MTSLAERIEKLDRDGRQIVEELTDLLLRKQESAAQVPTTPNKVSFEGWAGCLAHIDPDKSNKQLIREAWDAVIDKQLKD
jgi:hypothetical protein